MALAKSEGFLVGMDRGRTLAEEAVEQSRRAGDSLSPRARAALLRSLGQICWWHGDPQATVRYCREALQAVPDDISPLAAEALITMATPYLYRRDLDLALECAGRGLDIAQRLQLNELLPIAYATLGNVLTRRGDLAQAEAGLRQAMELSRGLGLETYAQVMAAGYLAYNLCQQGRADEARQIAESAIWPYAGSTDIYEVCVCRSVLADIALDAGQLEEAERLFANLLEIDSRRQYRIPLAMVYFGLAYIYLKTGRLADGARMAIDSINLIEPTGALQLYLDQGERGAVVGQALAGVGVKSPFIVRGNEPASSVPISVKMQNDSIRVYCLGTFRVFSGDCEVTQEQWVSAKARDLLAYFVTFRREPVLLDRVFDALWPEKTAQSKTAFHTALYRMRQALRTEVHTSKFILAEAGEYHLDAAHFHVDVDEFEALIARARTTRDEREAAGYYDQAISLYNGDYLDNLYYDWLLPERRRLSETTLNALRALAAGRANEGNYEAAQALLQHAITLDPLLEDLYCDLMRYCAEVGNRTGVVRQYQLLSQHLGDELGVPPSATTQDLYAQLMARLNRIPQSK
jgi:two-component SAPR family response regulator